MPHLEATGPAPRVAPAFEDTAFDVVAMAGSHGALQVLGEFLRRLPERFPAAVVVLLRWPPNMPLELTSLERASVLPITLAHEGQSLKPATVFFAPPGWHLLIKPNGSFRLSPNPAAALRPPVCRSAVRIPRRELREPSDRRDPGLRLSQRHTFAV